MEAIFHWKNDLYFWSRFESTARLALSDLQTGQVAADLGGGRRCAYAKSIDVGATLMAIDIDQNELDHNLDVELKVCGDISKQLPIEPNAVDLILSRALLEHVQDTNVIKQYARYRNSSNAV